MNKYKPYSQYKDSGVEWLGKIPNEWKIIKIGYLTTCLDGKRIPLNGEERSYREGDIPYWGANGIVDYINNYLFDEELVLIGEDGAPFFEKYKDVSFVVNGKIWVNNHAHILRVSNQLNSRFLSYSINQTDWHLYITGSTRDKLTQSDMNRILLRIPSIIEQQSIVNFLDNATRKIDTLIQKQQNLIELLKEKRQVLISHAVTKGLNPHVKMKDSGVEWLGEVPEHWEVKKTKQLFSLIVEPAPNDNDEELLSIYTDIGVKPRKDLEQKGNKATTTDGYWKVKVKDIIVNKLLAWMGAIGISEYDGVTSPAYDILRARGNIYPEFYHNLFRTKIAQNEFKRWSRGIMEMRLRLYFSEFGQIPMPVPSFNEQIDIVNYIVAQTTKIDTLISKAEKAIDLLKERRTALISATVTGKIDVREYVADNSNCSEFPNSSNQR